MQQLHICQPLKCVFVIFESYWVHWRLGIDALKCQALQYLGYKASQLQYVSYCRNKLHLVSQLPQTAVVRGSAFTWFDRLMSQKPSGSHLLTSHEIGHPVRHKDDDVTITWWCHFASITMITNSNEGVSRPSLLTKMTMSIQFHIAMCAQCHPFAVNNLQEFFIRQRYFSTETDGGNLYCFLVISLVQTTMEKYLLPSWIEKCLVNQELVNAARM